MSKSLLSLFAGLLTLSLVGCMGKMKYAECIAVMDDTTKAQTAYAEGLEKAKTGKEVAAAINAFSDSMKALKPRAQDIQKKFPELADAKNMPEACKESAAKQAAATTKMTEVMTKTLAKYDKDADVQKALTDMGKAMQ